MQRRFSLHRRAGIFYAQLWNDDAGKYLSARSTGARTRSEAVLVVAGWLASGLPTGRQRRPRPLAEAAAVDTILTQIRSASLTASDAGRILKALERRELIEGGVEKGAAGAEPLAGFLLRFWDYERSPYVREKLAHGQRIGRRRCYDATLAVKAHWSPFFKDRRLASIARGDLREFGLHLAGRLAGKTVNHVMDYGTVALRWAADNELIPVDPSRGVRRFAGKPKARGVLTPDEAAALFGVPWEDERARVGNLLAMTTGMRAGEILALQRRDIGMDRIHVRHSWSEVDRLKAPKTNEERTVPLVAGVRGELLALAGTNPHGSEEDKFVFYAEDPGRPMTAAVLRLGLRRALVRLSLSADDRKDPAKVRQAVGEWRARGLCVHSWRHFYAARMADRVDARTVMVATGHKTSAMFDHYADHALEEQLRQVGAAAGEIRILEACRE